ncbi:uncharacterized protein KNAG_0A06620 [Huiozyma naganishii CBS 8797]|uniref:U1 small nuclear ribonucleoprotein component SNU71 n=1 Tax=Huiozyma naganishii (strain ATCC MYA-139 / BCRC 22969 / CBS 8797 / KCTC 17520 / NBRC 10181 / NCYC 3082 / Yp74L-3) TaxID=1071383 RepID=J7RFJ2_HUIN7|nr:hypothetical protein KNAG_0A06620 [Kazachstania naganishii CBS 8797]CCK68318.1 hypothetical protein KNAG_0A06620 [Kazachstania naganishii CBS 8797]
MTRTNNMLISLQEVVLTIIICLLLPLSFIMRAPWVNALLLNLFMIPRERVYVILAVPWGFLVKGVLDFSKLYEIGDVTVVAVQPKTINKENVTSSQKSKETENNLEEPETADKESLVEDEHMNIKIAFKRAIDKPNDTEPNEAIKQMTRDENTTKTVPLSSKIDDILPYSGADLEQRLAKLKESRVVDELVNEYLGVYEDELVEYNFDNIRENKSKEVLFEDLKEIFDEDAIKIVDTICKREEFH